jgi:hypothetical protein
MFFDYKERFFVPLLIASLWCIIGCNAREKVNNDTGSIKGNLLIDTSILKKQDIFKLWLIDTLARLDTSILTQRKLEGIIANDIAVMPDSLGLSMNLYYDLIIGSNKNIKEESYPDKLLSLLNEYNEYPKQDSKLKFTVNYFYSPSPVPGLARDLLVELNNIEVVELNDKVVSKYTFIRGRLSDKTVTRVDKNGIPIKEYINFIWEGNKLVKRKLQ